MIAVVDSHGTPLKYINVRVAKGSGSSDSAIDDRFTDLAGHTAWPGGFVGDCSPSPSGWTLHVNDRNVNPAYGEAHLHVDSLDAAPINIALANVGGGTQPGACPSPSDKQAVSDWFFVVANSVGAHTNTSQNRQLMTPGFTACGAAWQHDSGGNTRARFFLEAGGPNNDSGFIVDTGDENGPFKLTFRY